MLDPNFVALMYGSAASLMHMLGKDEPLVLNLKVHVYRKLPEVSFIDNLKEAEIHFKRARTWMDMLRAQEELQDLLYRELSRKSMFGKKLSTKKYVAFVDKILKSCQEESKRVFDAELDRYLN